MTAAVPSFDLLSEPWIPCIDLDGRAIELGLVDTLLRAHELRAVADPSPLTTFAVYRFLLAVTHRVVGGPETRSEWVALWEAGRMDQGAVRSYLQRWSERFDLFQPRWPFYQTADFRIDDDRGNERPSSVARLVPELATGNNATLFDHTLEHYAPWFTPAQAARAILLTQTWGLGGGKGPKSNIFGDHPYLSHAPCVGAIAVVATGHTLFETIMMNLARVGPSERPPHTSGAEDRPSWEREEPRLPAKAVPTGYLEYLTWLPRHIRLKPPVEPGHVVDAFVAQGAILDVEAGFTSPFAFYRESEKFGRLPVRLDPDRALWRDSGTLFSLREDGTNRPAALQLCAERRIRRLLGEDARLRITCFALANDKAKPLTWRREEIPVPIQLLDDPDLVAELEVALAGIEAIHDALSRALRRLIHASIETETKGADAKDVARHHQRLAQHLGFWGGVERGFHEFLADLTPECRRVWHLEARRLAEEGLERAAAALGGTPSRRWRALAFARKELAIGLKEGVAPQQRVPPVSDPKEVVS